MDTFQQRIAGRQAAMAMLEEYDTDINARESALWETAVNTLKNDHPGRATNSLYHAEQTRTT